MVKCNKNSVVIIDYGSGNLHSIAKACEMMAGSRPIRISSAPEHVRNASHIILPGVGAFADCKAGIDRVDGMMEALTEAVFERNAWFLGVCVGMQLMAERGFEYGKHKGFGWIKGDVKRIEPSDASARIPHMGWNTLKLEQSHPVLAGIEDGDHAYFVHSYHMQCKEERVIAATTDYHQTLTAMVIEDNRIGTQFHPEKSQRTGLRLLKNFMEL